MVFLNIEKAFDIVRHGGLIYKMRKFMFPTWVIRSTMAYLENNKMVELATREDWYISPVDKKRNENGNTGKIAEHRTGNLIRKIMEHMNPQMRSIPNTRPSR